MTGVSQQRSVSGWQKKSCRETGHYASAEAGIAPRSLVPDVVLERVGATGLNFKERKECKIFGCWNDHTWQSVKSTGLPGLSGALSNLNLLPEGQLEDIHEHPGRCRSVTSF